MISVTIDSPSLDVAPQWDDLVRRASSNVFMNPAALKAACDTGFAKILMMLAWEQGAEPRQLVGTWALQLRKAAPNLRLSNVDDVMSFLQRQHFDRWTEGLRQAGLPD